MNTPPPLPARNPYAPPAASSSGPEAFPGSPFSEASQGKRFLNFIIDLFAMAILGAIGMGILQSLDGAGILPGTMEALESDSKQTNQMTGLVCLLVYYTLCEWMGGRTLGKLLTGTRAVRADGQPLGFFKALLRTLCRLIPLEPISFLGSSLSGWHDKLPGTLVVDIHQPLPQREPCLEPPA